MTSPATMRLVGLLVIVGMVAGCGGDEGMDPIAGTYHIDAEKSAEQAAEMALVHDADWKAAQTVEERERARRAFVELERRAIESQPKWTLMLRTDGTCEFKMDSLKSLDEGLPSVQAGTWRTSGNEVTLEVTHEDGRFLKPPRTVRYVYSAGSLYAPLDRIQRARQATGIGQVSEDGRVTLPLVIPVLTKE